MWLKSQFYSNLQFSNLPYSFFPTIYISLVFVRLLQTQICSGCRPFSYLPVFHVIYIRIYIHIYIYIYVWRGSEIVHCLVSTNKNKSCPFLSPGWAAAAIVALHVVVLGAAILRWPHTFIYTLPLALANDFHCLRHTLHLHTFPTGYTLISSHYTFSLCFHWRSINLFLENTFEEFLGT